MPIRIIIFEDNDKLRESLAYLLKSQPEYEMAGDYNNCNDAASITRVYKRMHAFTNHQIKKAAY